MGDVQLSLLIRKCTSCALPAAYSQFPATARRNWSKEGKSAAARAGCDSQGRLGPQGAENERGGVTGKFRSPRLLGPHGQILRWVWDLNPR